VAEAQAVVAWALDEVATAEMVQAAAAWSEASSVRDQGHAPWWGCAINKRATIT